MRAEQQQQQEVEEDAGVDETGRVGWGMGGGSTRQAATMYEKNIPVNLLLFFLFFFNPCTPAVLSSSESSCDLGCQVPQPGCSNGDDAQKCCRAGMRT